MGGFHLPSRVLVLLPGGLPYRLTVEGELVPVHSAGPVLLSAPATSSVFALVSTTTAFVDRHWSPPCYFGIFCLGLVFTSPGLWNSLRLPAYVIGSTRELFRAFFAYVPPSFPKSESGKLRSRSA